MYKCDFNPVGVQCERKECSKCGWNPEVAQARLEAIKAELYGKEKKDESNAS